MQKLYLDCDGVILDTIKRSYKMLKESGIIGEDAVTKFYSSIDWEKLIEESGEINDSLNKIKVLLNYFDIQILTHVNTNYESRVKTEYFGKNLPGVNVISVPKTIEKADYVDAKDSILVDDYTPNLDYWKNMGGIPVKFSDSGRECPYPVITDLLELIELCKKNKIKVKE